MEKHSLDVEISALKEAQSGPGKFHGWWQKNLNILVEIGVKSQGEHRNVFAGNQCKVILRNDKNQVFKFVKFYSVLTDELIKNHFAELLRIYILT